MLLLTFALLCTGLSAQDQLAGGWIRKENTSGVDIWENVTFSAGNQGTVDHHSIVNVDISMLGLKATGKVDSHLTGTFTFANGTLSIRWNRETAEHKILQPFKASMMGKEIPDIEGQLQPLLDAVANDINYHSVTINKDKLTLVTKDARGKKQTKKYTRK